MNSWEGGVHGEVDAGAIELGLIVTERGVGVALDAPELGRLRAAFDVSSDGTTYVTALSREGVPVQGLTDRRRLLELEQQLESKDQELGAVRTTVAALESRLQSTKAEAERHLEQARSALSDTRASLEQTDSARQRRQEELAESRKALAEAEARLKRSQTELTRQKAAIAETELKLRSTEAAAAAAAQRSDELQAERVDAHAELLATKKSLGEAEGRLRRLQTQHDLNKEELDARASAAAAELGDLTARLSQADELKTAQDAMLDQLRAEIERLSDAKEAEAQRAEVAEVERDEALRKAQLAEELRRSEVERVTADLSDLRVQHAEALATEQATASSAATALEEQLTQEKRRAGAAELRLKEEQKLVQRQKAELEEERARREEMLKDLAYIQSQVKDLASTKGALVARVNSMSDRESRRQRTTAEMTDVLRTAEVVAADTRAAARRHEARAQKLEDQVRGMTQEIVELRGRTDTSENGVRMLGEQLAKMTKERDALKVDVAFFQKQIGSLQRAAGQEKLKPKK
jgi:chromosome segregation ATPase